jgi:hypothetical protein
MTAVEDRTDVYAEATKTVRQLLAEGLSEPARTRAIKELESRVRKVAKMPGLNTQTAEETARTLYIGSLHAWGDKEVQRLIRAGSTEEAAALRRELEVMKEARPKKMPEPVIGLNEIPRYFGGGSPEGAGTLPDINFDHAVDALVALTGRTKQDPAIRLILIQHGDAFADLLDMTCSYGRCIPDGQPAGIDEWDDDTLEAVTGYRRVPREELTV